MPIKIVNDLPAEAWNDFILNNPSGNIFHTREMYEVFSRTKNYKPEVWAAVNNGRIIALLLPVYINLFKSPLLGRLTTRSVCFGGIVFENSDEGKKGIIDLLNLYSGQAKKNAVFTEIRNFDDLTEVQPLIMRCKYQYENHINFLVYLDEIPEKVFMKIGARTRKNLKRALKKNQVQIEEIKSLDKLEACYELLRITYKRAAVPLADYSLFKSAFEILFPSNMLKVTMASVDGQAAAVSFDLLFKKTIFGWYGGVNRKYKNYMPNDLLTWKIIEWGCRNGFRVYDFGGAGNPQQKYGVRDFKAKFGGEKVDYGRFRRIHSRYLYYPLIVLYEAFRPILFGKHR